VVVWSYFKTGLKLTELTGVVWYGMVWYGMGWSFGTVMVWYGGAWNCIICCIMVTWCMVLIV
jgi:hypothetical protein